VSLQAALNVCLHLAWKHFADAVLDTSKREVPKRRVRAVFLLVAASGNPCNGLDPAGVAALPADNRSRTLVV